MIVLVGYVTHKVLISEQYDDDDNGKGRADVGHAGQVSISPAFFLVLPSQTYRRTKLARRCPVVMLVVSNASLGRDPIRPRIVVRTASWTRGSAVAVNLAIRSDGLTFDTT